MKVFIGLTRCWMGLGGCFVGGFLDELDERMYGSLSLILESMRYVFLPKFFDC